MLARWTRCLAIAAGAVVWIGLQPACGGSRGARLDTAGGDRDEGAGDLARASLHLVTGTPDEADGFTSRSRSRALPRRSASYPSLYGGGSYGGGVYGGMPYGGVGYANWVVPQWTSPPQSRAPNYNVSGGLSGSIEGTVTWAGAPPTKLPSPCGPIDNPTLRVGTDKAARGVLVYIDRVDLGRGVPYYTRPVSVGGTVAKRGCALVPAAQVVAPLPGSLTIHGDESRAKLRITPDKGTPLTQELQEGGFVQVEAKPGITRVESDDGKLAAAWVIGLESPYYAITDDAGRYRIDELAPGSYELTFWQPPVAAIGPNGTWTYGAPTVARRTVTIGAKAAQLSVALAPPR